MHMHKSIRVILYLFYIYAFTTHAMVNAAEPAHNDGEKINHGFKNARNGVYTSPVQIDEMSKRGDDEPIAENVKKFRRGFENALHGVWEMPIKMDETTKQSDAFQGLTTGSARGFGLAVARIGTGLYEMATFLVPQEKGYEVLIQPEKPALVRKLGN